MEKIRNILASAAGKKPGPPVPPRPSPAAVQKALEKTRTQSPNFPHSGPPAIQGRTIIYSSSAHVKSDSGADRQPRQTNVSRDIKCFDTRGDDSSTGLSKDVARNGNSARVSETMNEKVERESTNVILHHKSPVPRPRISPERKFGQKVSTVQPAVAAPIVASCEPNSYAKLLTRNQNLAPADAIVKINQSLSNRDDVLKEKLLSEMVGRSKPNEISQSADLLPKLKSSNLKRSSSFDILNETLGDKASDKKVIFHEMLISELSEMRRDSNPRLSSAKSSPDISPSGNQNVFEIGERKSMTFLDDSGVEDEGRTDDCSSSGVGDSWDSCKEMETR